MRGWQTEAVREGVPGLVEVAGLLQVGGIVPEQENNTWRSSDQLLSHILSSLFPSGQDSGLGQRGRGPRENRERVEESGETSADTACGGGGGRRAGQGVGGRDSTDDS